MRRVLREVKPARAAFRETERGAALTELAIVLPLLTFLLLTIFDLGIVLREYQILQNATREGARFAIHPAVYGGTQGPTVNEVRQRVIDYMAQEGITVAAGAISVNPTEAVPTTTGVTLQATRVTVTYTTQLLIGGAGILPTGELTLSASSVFQNLYMNN